MTEWPDLSDILGGLRWAVIGAVATRHYMPERVTQDLDIMVAAVDATQVRELLRQAGFRHLGELAVGGSTWRSSRGIEIDVLEAREAWLCEGIEQAASNRDLQGLPVIALPALVVLKLRSGRLQDLADATRMLGQATDDQLAAVRELARQYQPQDLEDLETMIELGRRELGG